MTFEEQDKLQIRAIELLNYIHDCIAEWDTWAEMGIFKLGVMHVVSMLSELEDTRRLLGDAFPADLVTPLHKLTKPWISPVTFPGGSYTVQFNISDNHDCAAN